MIVTLKLWKLVEKFMAWLCKRSGTIVRKFAVQGPWRKAFSKAIVCAHSMYIYMTCKESCKKKKNSLLLKLC